MTQWTYSRTMPVQFSFRTQSEFVELFLFTLKPCFNKKVLLRERKRHTDRGVSSTTRWGTPLAKSDWGVPKVGYPPLGYPPARSDRGGTQGGVPPIGVPPSQVWLGVPKVEYPPPARSNGGGTWGEVSPQLGYPLARSDGGAPGGGYSPPGPGSGTPLSGYPPSQVQWGSTQAGVPPYLDLAQTWLRYPPTWTGSGTPPGVDRQMDGQTRVKT